MLLSFYLKNKSWAFMYVLIHRPQEDGNVLQCIRFKVYSNLILFRNMLFKNLQEYSFSLFFH